MHLRRKWLSKSFEMDQNLYEECYLYPGASLWRTKIFQGHYHLHIIFHAHRSLWLLLLLHIFLSSKNCIYCGYNCYRLYYILVSDKVIRPHKKGASSCCSSQLIIPTTKKTYYSVAQRSITASSSRIAPFIHIFASWTLLQSPNWFLLPKHT